MIIQGEQFYSFYINMFLPHVRSVFSSGIVLRMNQVSEVQLSFVRNYENLFLKFCGIWPLFELAWIKSRRAYAHRRRTHLC